MNRFVPVLAILFASAPAFAEEAPAPPPRTEHPYSTRPSVMSGLGQWLVLGGGNVAAQLKFGRFAVEYSHGHALRFDRVAAIGLTEDERAADVGVTMSWTTGGGFGVQITPKLHVLLEVKAHHYQITGADRNQKLEYTTFTLGPGVFYDLYLYRDFFIQPSLRWWPTIASTYDGDGVLMAPDGAEYRHDRHDLTVPFVNVNLGWTLR